MKERAGRAVKTWRNGIGMRCLPFDGVGEGGGGVSLILNLSNLQRNITACTPINVTEALRTNPT